MSEIKITDIDSAILDRITESEIKMWLAAKLMSLQQVIGSTHSLNIGATHFVFNRVAVVSIRNSMHAAGSCVTGEHDSLDESAKALRFIVHGDPAKKAAEKRAEARRILEDAEALEREAAKL